MRLITAQLTIPEWTSYNPCTGNNSLTSWGSSWIGLGGDTVCNGGFFPSDQKLYQGGIATLVTCVPGSPSPGVFNYAFHELYPSDPVLNKTVLNAGTIITASIKVDDGGNFVRNIFGGGVTDSGTLPPGDTLPYNTAEAMNERQPLPSLGISSPSPVLTPFPVPGTPSQLSTIFSQTYATFDVTFSDGNPPDATKKFRFSLAGDQGNLTACENQTKGALVYCSTDLIRSTAPDACDFLAGVQSGGNIIGSEYNRETTGTNAAGLCPS